MEEANTICSMAIYPGRQIDRLIWLGTKNGEFSVRSAYHLAKECEEVDKGSCSNGENMSALWKAVWRVKCPRVVQNFLWKACNNILPTKDNLYKRGITADSNCLICERDTETVS